MGLASGQRCPERDTTSLNPSGQRGQWKASFEPDALVQGGSPEPFSIMSAPLLSYPWPLPVPGPERKRSPAPECLLRVEGVSNRRSRRLSSSMWFSDRRERE
jgi:hypothetical protein